MMTKPEETRLWLVMRSHNDSSLVADTLAALAQQTIPFRLAAFDNASSDGTREIVQSRADLFVDVPAGSYVPGVVLNHAMRVTDGEFVIFLNADCTPQHPEFLAALLQCISRHADTAAVFGRQNPRPDCQGLFAKDTTDTYGDGTRQAAWRHCFSMAGSCIRRACWEESPFREDLQYSEDIDWTWRMRQRGYAIRYASDAQMLHSHNYTLRQYYRRHYGEGAADACIFAWTTWEQSFLRYSLFPYARQVLSDMRYCLARGMVGAAAYSPLLRFAQMLGRRAGFRAGCRQSGQAS